MAEDYRQKLYNDLPEQFRDQPRIKALMDVLGGKLNEIQQFAQDVHDKTALQTAQGAQLDRIGDIVVLSRYEAGVLACLSESVFYLEDDRYRDYLIYKIWKNTNHTTYADVYKGLRIFWDRPLYYSEDPNIPACMIFDTGEMDGWVDTRPLMDMPIIRAAGVGFRLYARTKTEMPPAYVYVVTGFLNVAEGTLPWFERDIDYDTGLFLRSGFLNESIEPLPQQERDIDYTAEVEVKSDLLNLAENRPFPSPPVEQDFPSFEGLGYSIMETPIGDVSQF